MLVLGTHDGVWKAGATGAERLGLAGKRVSHVAARDECVLAAVPRDGLYRAGHPEGPALWKGDVRSCAIAPDGALFLGIEPAMVFRSEDGGRCWRRLSSIDGLPTRATWTFPPPPHQPHVLSIDFLPGEPDCVLAGVEVGGVLLSRDRGQTWVELNRDIYVDVHSVRPDPTTPGRLFAVTGRGFYASENGGASWERRMDGVVRGYTIGLAINAERAGEVMIASGDRPPGLNAAVYHSLDAGRSWVELIDPALPQVSPRAAVPLFADGAAWLASDDGRLLRAEDARGPWDEVLALGTPINAAAAGGSPSSVMH